MAASLKLPHSSGPFSFTIAKLASTENEARLGLLQFRGRMDINTPHYIAISSRGCVPHLTQDMMRDQTSIKGIYAGLEDYVESLPQPPPLFSFPCPPIESPLRRFIALQRDALLILGPRRHPNVPVSDSNTYTSLRIFTSVGHRYLEVETYIEAVQKLRPDVVVGIADVERRSSGTAHGLKRKEKMTERTKAWMRALQEAMKHVETGEEAESSLWAPILPFEAEMQREYLDSLEEAEAGSIQGLVIYDNHSLSAIPPILYRLPRMSLTEPRTPHQVLTAISLGIDLLILPFVTIASEAGIAFTFSFPPPSSEPLLPLGINMWSVSHARDLSPLQKDCDCYTCQKHHRAYVQHLLSAKEMLAWVLLQVHNHHVIDRFFKGVRASIGSITFEKDANDFERAYEADFPAFVGKGPRTRGYHSTSTGANPKKLNKPAWSKFTDTTTPVAKRNEPNVMNEGMEKVKESKEAPPMSPGADTIDLEDLGFAELYK